MARPTIPDSVERRNLLHGGKATPSTLAAIGEALERDRRFTDALDFFTKAGDDAGIGRIWEIAIETGHSFLVSRVRRLGVREVKPADWERAAEAAERSGRFQDALICLQEAGDTAKLESLRERLRATDGSANGAPAPAAPPKPPI